MLSDVAKFKFCGDCSFEPIDNLRKLLGESRYMLRAKYRIGKVKMLMLLGTTGNLTKIKDFLRGMLSTNSAKADD